jgi:steroid delta-isomerase-like uncharacterized protein
METNESNKEVVRRFNREVIERGDERAFAALLAPDFVNRSAGPGMPTGADGMRYVLLGVLRPALPDLSVEIHDQIAEGDLVTTRKTLRGTHRGDLFGLPATGKKVEIQVMDIVRVRNGQYVEHWGMNDLATVMEGLKKQ